MKTQPMIFISHSAREQPAAEALRDFLAEAVDIEPEKILCAYFYNSASCAGKSSDLLKSDLAECAAVFAVVTPESISTDWVLFELGAAWILGKSLYFVYMDGVDFRDLPAPLSGFPYVDMDGKDAPIRIMSVCREVASSLGLQLKRGPRIPAALERMTSIMKGRPKDDGSAFEADPPDLGNAEESAPAKEGKWGVNDCCDVTCTADSASRKEVITVPITWDDIFLALAPNMRSPQDERFMESVIMGLCKDRDHNFQKGLSYKLFNNPAIKPESLSLILSRLVSLNFIAASNPPRTVFQKKSRDAFWMTTQRGEEYLREMLAERRKLRANPDRRG
jgi:hypothetical protein